MLEPFFAPIHENEFIVLRSASEGSVVFLERLDRHRLDHGWRELPVNSVFEVHDGTISVWRDYFDLGTASRIHSAGAGRRPSDRRPEHLSVGASPGSMYIVSR